MNENPPPPLSAGLYEHIVTRALSRQAEYVSNRAELESLPPDLAPLAFTQLLQDRLLHAFEQVPTENKLQHQLDLANKILHLLRSEAPRGGATEADLVDPPARRLLAVRPEPKGNLATATTPERPRTPLSVSSLLVNGRQDLSIGPELQRELASADRVDLLCSFLKWNGFRLLRTALQEFLERCPGQLRVLTTTYMGATDRKALDALAELGAEVKVSYDTGRTRLHAKSWMFHRNSGLTTAYIGSSNLSASALLDGLEWNVRLSVVDNAPILRRFKAAFEQYWSEPEFESYDPDRDGERFARAVRRQSPDETPLFVDLMPRPHQQEILDSLAAERAHGHTRNLVVAATGTGKTVVAALDYRRLAEEVERGQPRPSLLFVAHRQEILKQSLQTYRLALRDGSFGELLVGGEVPANGRHVFASIQSLHSERIQTIHPEAFDILVVDEFHHAAADSYERLLTHLKPRYLLGLTATPERADGQSVLQHFDDRIASELRLWRALDEGLLSPFQYFGVHGPDLSHVAWKRGRYDPSALSGVYTADHALALRVVQQIHDKIADVSQMRALAFCVDVNHALFMAERFRKAGWTAEAISGATDSTERNAALRRLESGDLQILCSVDLFNEGVDLPQVDTVLFLRPTESATLFLQQLGRGLRPSPNKPCCTVLDFIGNASRRFRFDLRFRAIVGGTRRQVQRQIEEGFPALPSGCSISLDREAQDAVLTNIRSQLGSGQKGLVEDLKALGPKTKLDQFLVETGFDLEDVYEGAGLCFANLRRKAGFAPPESHEGTLRMERALARLLHIDDAYRLRGFQEFLASDSPPAGDPDSAAQRMLFVLLGGVRLPFSEMDRHWADLWSRPDLREELRTLMALLEDRTRRLTIPLTGDLAALPFQTHGTYSLDEVLAGADERTAKGGVLRIQSGVHYAQRHSCDLLFVTLEKSEREYTPTTLYRDYPLTPTRFHWETQSACHPGTPTGRRYLSITRGAIQHALLFVRERRKDPRGETMPYLLLGPAYYQSSRRERPMQIEWELAHAMPASTFQEMKVAAG
ncbi:MAG: DUF3427 domain-containing protein [bacterium]